MASAAGFGRCVARAAPESGVLACSFGVLSGSGDRCEGRAACWSWVGLPVWGSGGGERANPGQRGEVVAVPWPAGGQVKRPGAAVARQPARDREQPAAECAGGAHGAVGQADQLGPPEQVVRERAGYRPGAVGVELAGWEVRQRLILELDDYLFDDGMVTMFGLDQGDVFGAVGEKREVTPVGPQLGLRSDQPGAADN
jgi:hypothetical protein